MDQPLRVPACGAAPPCRAPFWAARSWRADRPFAEVADVLSPAAMEDAAQALAGWADYAPTPVRSLAGLARALGLGEVLCKDESRRFGRGGVKALGAPYGLALMLRDRLPDLPPWPALMAGAARDLCTPFTAVAATDGNHGLALAWAARRFGCQARIFVGRDVNDARLALIRQAGGDIAVVDGTYDDAVLAAEARAAADPCALLVTDTDYVGDRTVTRAIMAGYSVLGRELAAQPGADWPTHVFLQTGVGGMAAGVTAGLWAAGGQVPRVVTVEPVTAACVLESLRAGAPTAVPGDLHTLMAGLSCGRPSLPAWTILRLAAAGALAISDDIASAALARLRGGTDGDAPLPTGDTGIAGIAGLVAAATTPQWRAALGLGPDSRVLVVNSEGPLPPTTAPAGVVTDELAALPSG